MEREAAIAARRYDIDWLRVIAIGLLLIYHVAIGFQSWGVMIGFIATPDPWPALWVPMTLLNVWRIPLLFFVSGMGVYFAMRHRSWKQLIRERAARILLPFVFGMFAVVPVHILIWRYYYGMDLRYSWAPGHLWFLGNIFVYVLALSPLFYYLMRNEAGRLVQGIKKLLGHSVGLLVVGAVFVLEVVVIRPVPFELYAMTGHGFCMGMLAFFFGFCFVLAGAAFWSMIQHWRWVFVVLAFTLYMVRGMVPDFVIALESLSWVMGVLAFGSMYLNRPSTTLAYLSQAAYPVYIVHMVFLYLGSLLLFDLPLGAPLQFLLVLLFTIAGCFGSFEVIRRVGFLRPLFGMKVR